MRHHDLADAGDALNGRAVLAGRRRVLGRLEQADRQEVMPGQHVARQRLVAVLEDVQRQQRVRKQHDVGQRKHRQPSQRLTQVAIELGHDGFRLYQPR